MEDFIFSTNIVTSDNSIIFKEGSSAETTLEAENEGCSGPSNWEGDIIVDDEESINKHFMEVEEPLNGNAELTTTQAKTTNYSPFDVYIGPDSQTDIRIIESNRYGGTTESLLVPPKQCQRFKVTLKYKKDLLQPRLIITSEASMFNFQSTSPPIPSSSLSPPQESKSQLGSSSLNQPLPKRRLANEKPVKCRHCDKRFNCTGAEKIHYDSVHLGIKYQCLLCKREFPIVVVAYKHLKDAHQQETRKCEEKEGSYSRNFKS